MTFRLVLLLVIINLVFPGFAAFAQTDSVIGQVSNSNAESFAGGMSGNGRFVVFESRGNLATDNPRNTDNNVEIFLFDYAQRRIFQITDTKSVLFNTTLLPTFNNIRVEISNTRPVISNDGRWIAFSSNATASTPAAPDTTNPGSFDGNSYTSPTPTITPTPTPTGTPTATPTGSPTATPTPAANPLTSDGNLEMWLYEIPAYAQVADLSTGDDIPVTDLSGGNFIRVTNTDPSQLPRAGTPTTGAFIADDNHDASISDDGSVIAFVSTRDLVPSIGNPFPTEDNDEIFTYVRTSSTLGQITKTPRGMISDPIYNKNPTISGNGSRVVFTSTGDNPVVGMTGGVNPDTSRNEEIFFADLISGSPTEATIKKQVTTTTPTNPGDPVNILDLGRRMSRDGNYIAFDSYADLASENSGTNYTSFALYLYDATADSFRRIGPRSDADTQALGGDLAHYPGFTDDDAAGTPSTLVLETRLNIKADGTIPKVEADGLNPNPVRPAQVYSYPLNAAPEVATFTRLAKFPPPTSFLASTQLMPSNALKRMSFNLGLTELGTYNPDLFSEVYYYLQPDVVNQSPITTAFATGATRIPVSLTAIPTPSATATPTASPTVSPTATPTFTPTSTPTATPTASPTASPTATSTPTATPTATPETPPAVFGLAPGMSAILDYQAGFDRGIIARTAVGSIDRRFTLPIELSGLTMTINGAACGLKAVSRHKIEFVVPPGLLSDATGTMYPLVINNNGTVMKSMVTIVPARPDIFNIEGLTGPGGRAKIFNVTNTVHTTEPFAVRTIKRKGNMLVPSVLRVYLTGVGGISPSFVNVRVRDSLIPALGEAVLVEPGVYTLDFALPAALQGAGDQPIVVVVTIGSVTFNSRLDDTTSRLFIL